MCIYVCMFVCVHAHVCRGQGSTLGILCCSLPYLRLRLLLRLKIGWLASKPQGPPVSTP